MNDPSNPKLILKRRHLLLAAAGGLTTALGCSSDDETPSAATNLTTLRLVRRKWLGAELNCEIAKLLLEGQLGLKVEFDDEADGTTQYGIIAEGKSHVSLEVWPGGKQALEDKFIGGGKVENIGLLGPLGKIGWYVPQYFRDEFPQLATHQGLKDPMVIERLKTPQSGSQGQFLAADPEYSEQFDDQIIKNLGLDLKVVFAGSEQKLLENLDAAYAQKQPLLFYFWTPHWAISKYDLHQIELPAWNEACYAKSSSGGIDCDYKAHQLFKMLWPSLQQQAPRAYKMLKQLSYSTKDQISMMAAVELDGKSRTEAAQAWLDSNETVWKAWLT